MRAKSISVVICGALLLCSSFVACVRAETAPEFPATMINSPPLNKDGLKGKVVVLYFFEEDCPRCREGWPARLKVAQGYVGKPVIFIAVNSGNAGGEVASYLKETNVNWPTIVDTNRSFEKAAGVNEISLQNIYQALIITPEGDLVSANPSALNESVDRYLPQAKWRIDPADIPDGLKPAWQLIEIGNFNQAGKLLAASKKSIKDEAGKTAAEKLAAAITEEFTKVTAAPAAAETAGKTWDAYKGYQTALVQFADLPETKELKTKVAKLANDPQVTRELRRQALDGSASHGERGEPGVAKTRDPNGRATG
ncbi:MAG: redoxin family protein [Pirellulales bacterium]